MPQARSTVTTQTIPSPFVPPAAPTATPAPVVRVASHSYGAFGPGSSSDRVTNASYSNNAFGGNALTLNLR